MSHPASKFLLSAVCVVTPVLLAPAGAAGGFSEAAPAWEFTSAGHGFTNGNWDFATAFKVGSPVSISALGYFSDTVSTSSGGNAIALYQCANATCTGTGTVLAVATVTGASPFIGHFQYVAISPFNLTVGLSYEVAGVSGSNNYTWDDPGFSVNPAITIITDGNTPPNADRWQKVATPQFLSAIGNDIAGQDGFWGSNLLLGAPIVVSTSIDAAQAYYAASSLGTTLNPAFAGGTLRMDQPGATYAQNFTLDGSGTNTIDQNGNNSTFSGVFSDAAAGTPGSVIIANGRSGGSITFTGYNVYSGTTTINPGATLALAGGGGIFTSAGLIDNGTFDISATPGTLITTLSGSGAVNLGGEILFLVEAAGSFSGGIAGTAGSGVVIAAGTEHINGTLTASSLAVWAGGELRGTGLINAPTTVYGTLAPGNSPGTLTFGAPLRLMPGSTSEFDIDGSGTGTGAGNYSRVVVTGNGNTDTVDGVLEPLLRGPAGSFLPDWSNRFTPAIGQSFMVVAAQGGVNGSYASLTQPAGLPAGTRFDAIYTPQTLSLVVTPASYGSLPAAGLPETAGPAAVGSALDAIRPAAGIRMGSSESAVFYPLYGLPGPAVAPALQQLAPTIYGDGLMAARQTWYEMADSIADRLASGRAGTASAQTVAGPHGSTIWMNGLGQFSDVSGSAMPGYHTSFGGAIAGIDFRPGPGLIAGAAIGGGGIQTSSNGATDTGSAIQFSIYGGVQSGIFFLDGQAGYMHVDQDIRRDLAAWGTTAKGSNGLDGGGLQAHAGVRLTRGAWQIEPALGLTAISLAGGPAGETTGGALAEQIAHQSINSVQSLLGLRVGTQVAVTPKLPLYAHALVGWQHEFADTAANTSGMFQLAGSAPFIVSNTPVARDAARLGIGLDGSVSQAVTLYVTYQASLGTGTTAQYLTGGVRVTW